MAGTGGGSGSRSPDDAGGGIDAFIAAATEPIGIVELARRWRMARITLRCAGAAGIVGNPNAPGKIRGAWGRALAAAASPEAVAGGPCPWAAPCAYDVLFNRHGRMTARLEIPKPWVIALDPEGDDLAIAVSLFGIAADWAGEAAGALVRALGTGLDGQRGRRALTVADRDIAIADGMPVAVLAQGAVLRFLSPVALRDGEAIHVRPATLITSLANRLGGMARWHGARLDLDAPALKREAERVGQAAEWVDAASVAWRRRSAAQGRTNAMAGLVGELHLPPVSSDVAALLALGAMAHVGSRTAFGLGRYELFARGIAPAAGRASP